LVDTRPRSVYPQGVPKAKKYPLLSALKPRYRVFVLSFVRTWNATQAADDAGYSTRTARTQGYRLLKNDDIQAAISEVLASNTMSTEEILARIGQEAIHAARAMDRLKALDMLGKAKGMFIHRHVVEYEDFEFVEDEDAE